MIRLSALAALLFLVACGATATPVATATPTVVATTAAATPVGTPRPASGATPTPATPPPASPTAGRAGPPPLTLSYGTATRVARPHSATWTTPGGGGMIADGAPILGQLEILTVPLGATLTFAAAELTGPTYAAVQAYAIVNGQLRYSTPGPASLPTRLTAQGATITADLAPGEYLLLVNLNWGNNQASYGFRVAVATGAVPAPPGPPADWPPTVALGYGGTTRTARAVNSIWTSANFAVIGDGFPSPANSETLVAPVGARLALAIGGTESTTGIVVHPYPVVAGRTQVGLPSLPNLPIGFAWNASTISADLAPGEYLIEINV